MRFFFMVFILNSLVTVLAGHFKQSNVSSLFKDSTGIIIESEYKKLTETLSTNDMIKQKSRTASNIFSSPAVTKSHQQLMSISTEIKHLLMSLPMMQSKTKSTIIENSLISKGETENDLATSLTKILLPSHTVHVSNTKISLINIQLSQKMQNGYTTNIKIKSTSKHPELPISPNIKEGDTKSSFSTENSSETALRDTSKCTSVNITSSFEDLQSITLTQYTRFLHSESIRQNISAVTSSKRQLLDLSSTQTYANSFVDSRYINRKGSATVLMKNSFPHTIPYKILSTIAWVESQYLHLTSSPKLSNLESSVKFKTKKISTSKLLNSISTAHRTAIHISLEIQISSSKSLSSASTQATFSVTSQPSPSSFSKKLSPSLYVSTLIPAPSRTLLSGHSSLSFSQTSYNTSLHPNTSIIPTIFPIKTTNKKRLSSWIVVIIVMVLVGVVLFAGASSFNYAKRRKVRLHLRRMSDDEAYNVASLDKRFLFNTETADLTYDNPTYGKTG